MKNFFLSSLLLSLATSLTASAAFSAEPLERPITYHAPVPQSLMDHFGLHNASMTEVQPSWATPVVEPDPRLIQYDRFSFSSEYTAAGTHTMNYGNGRGGGVIGWRRVEVDFAQPAYIQHNSTAVDGFGDASATVKVRIASGNSDHGNYIVTAILSHCFATGSAKNGAITDGWTPTLAAGVGVGKRIALESTLGGTMPNGKIATQGRTIVWNGMAEFHATPHVWLEVENNSTYFFAGSHDGKMQNFVTPGAFYILRRKEWKPMHPYFVFDVGMQMATSGFHTYNHNLIPEMRVLF